MIRRIKVLKQYILFFMLGFTLLIFLFPLILTFTVSFIGSREMSVFLKPVSDITYKGWVELKLIPRKVTIRQYYILLIEQFKYILMFWNSIKYAISITVGQSVVSSMAAFAFAKMNFKYRDKVFFLYIVAMMMPFQVTMIPNYIALRKLQMINTAYAVILPGIFAPFGVFLLRQYIRTMPNDIIEAALMDGAGSWKVFSRIVVPLSVPGLATLGILCFIDSWNLVEQPLFFLDNINKYPLSLSLNSFIRDVPNVAFSGSVLYMIPMFLLFLVLQEHIIKGIEIRMTK